jgi:short-subunit dehydrogenase
MSRSLQGMVCVITGASAGIGRSLARTLSARGAALTLSARRLDRLRQLNEQFNSAHQVIQADVSQWDQCHRLVEQAHAHHGRIDTLICNAGHGLISPIARTSESQWLEILRTNVLGTAACIEAAVPLMRTQPPRNGWRGQILIVSSAAARRGLPWFGAYSATKAAQLSIAEALRVELANTDIAVTSVHPVGAETDFFTTAEQLSARRVPQRGAAAIRQPVERIVEAMLKGIANPKPEIWPRRSMRWAVGLGVFTPRLADRILRRHRPA